MPKDLAIIEDAAVLYPEATIKNFQKNRNKIVIKRNSRIRGHLKLLAYGGYIEIGENSYIGENTQIWSGELVKIGKNVLISHGVSIIDTDSHELNSSDRVDTYLSLLKDGPPTDQGSIKTGSIIIHDEAWISFNAIILKGVTIGKGAIVAAGTIVTKNVPDYAVVAGNPAKIIRYTT
ncbi:acyltransferase [Catalinimonas alkaloidigena]